MKCKDALCRARIRRNVFAKNTSKTELRAVYSYKLLPIETTFSSLGGRSKFKKKIQNPSQNPKNSKKKFPKKTNKKFKINNSKKNNSKQKKSKKQAKKI